MSGLPGSGISKRVYVKLVGEGTVVYRPASATAESADAWRLTAPDDYEPEDERWEFPPGSLVRVEPRTLEGTEVLVVVSLAE